MNPAHISVHYVRDDAYKALFRQAIDDLLDDGLLYSTIDQYHFKLVD